MKSGKEIKHYKVKALPVNPSPDSVYYVKPDEASEVSAYISNLQGVPFHLFTSGGGSGTITDITNTDGYLSIVGTEEIFINLSAAMIALLNSKENIANKINVISGNSTTEYPSEKAIVDYVDGRVGSLLREEFEYIGFQTFELNNDYAQVYSVEVRGVGALSETQYTLTPPNQVTINDQLEDGDFIVIIYSQDAVGINPFYTQAQTDNLLDLKEDLINKQDSLDFDGTGDKYPTVDTINEAFLRNTKLFARTGISNKNDQFELVVFDANTVTINPVDSAVFWDELFVPNAVSSDAIKTFPQIQYPLSELVTATGGNINTNPIVTDGVYVRYLGYDKDGNVVSSPDSFIESSAVAQLGFVTVIKSGVTVSFLGGITPGARNVFSQPILANLNDLDRITVTTTTDISINYNIGSPSLKSNAGTITGIAINWRGLNNPNNTSPIDKFNYLGDAVVDFVCLDPLSLSQVTPFVFHTLWTELDSGVAVNESFFNTTSQLRDTLAANTFAIKRVLIGTRGGIFIQESEFATNAAYTTLEEAQANVFTHEFTETIIPPGLVTEIARIIFKKGVTDFSDDTQFFIVITAGGAGSGGGITSVGDATTVSKGVIQLAQDLSGTATNPTVPGLLLKENLSNKVDIISGSSSTEYPTENAVVTYVDSKIPTDYSKIVYVNDVNPNTATIFDLNNPPTIDDNVLKNDTSNLYIGTDNSTWVYNGAIYVTKTVTSIISNFYLAGTTTDAGNTKTAAIERTGTVGGAQGTASNHFITKAQLDLKSDNLIIYKVVSTTTYTLISSDSGKQLIFTNASAITVTIPTGLVNGFNCEMYQQGSGAITVTTSGTTLRYSTFELPVSAEQYSLIAIDNVPNIIETYHIFGQISAI